MKNQNVNFIQMNECKGEIKELYVIIHVDKDGNEGLLAEPAMLTNALTGELRMGGKVEVSPYDYDLSKMEEYAKQLQEVIGDEYKVKVKKFVYK